jgi:hypothetical protein
MAVAKHHLDDANVGPALQKVGGKAVSQRVGGHMFADPCALARGAAGCLQSPSADMTARFLAREQPQARPSPLPIATQNVEEPRRQHCIPIPAALAVLDVDQHPLAVDRADLQSCHFSDPQACGVGCRQRDTIAQSCNRFQEAPDLLSAENRRKPLRLLASDDTLERLLVTKRDAVKEPQRTRDLVDVRPRPLLRDQMKLVGPNILHAELIRRPVEVSAKLCHCVEVGLLCRARQIADRHVLDHAPTQRAHRSHVKLLS